MSKLIVKIGGSFLTKKADSEKFPGNIEGILSEGDGFIEKERLKSLSLEIRKISREHQIMIIHGAGPFGHALVERIFSGVSIDPLDVHRSMMMLNEKVNFFLQEQGINCVTLSPLDFVEYNGEFDTGKLILKMRTEVDSGNMPISHGDIVRAKIHGRLGKYKVISGDILASDLALGWQADSVIMITDTDGILDKDPTLGCGKRIPRIAFRKCVNLLRGREAKGADVTGGILSKVLSCEKTIRSGIPLIIISGVENGNLVSASQGDETGTIIESG